MKECKKCHNKLSWWVVLKGICSISETITCNKCNTQYVHTRLSKFFSNICIIILPLIFSNITQKKLDLGMYGILTFIIPYMIFLFLSPFFVHLKLK